MDINEFDYNLPENLIAQTPIENRSESKLLVMDRKTGALEDKIFKDITSYFHKGDVLVLNDTKVLPARIFGIKEKTGARSLKKIVEEMMLDTLFELPLNDGTKIIEINQNKIIKRKEKVINA